MIRRGRPSSGGWVLCGQPRFQAFNFSGFLCVRKKAPHLERRHRHHRLSFFARAQKKPPGTGGFLGSEGVGLT